MTDLLFLKLLYCNCVFSDPHEETCWIILYRSPPVKPSCAVKPLAGILMQWHHWSAWTLPIGVTSRISGLFPLYFCIHVSPGFFVLLLFFFCLQAFFFTLDPFRFFFQGFHFSFPRHFLHVFCLSMWILLYKKTLFESTKPDTEDWALRNCI